MVAFWGSEEGWKQEEGSGTANRARWVADRRSLVLSYRGEKIGQPSGTEKPDWAGLVCMPLYGRLGVLHPHGCAGLMSDEVAPEELE